MKANFLFTFFLGIVLLGSTAFKTGAGDKEYIMCIVHGEYTQQQGMEMAAQFRQAYPAVSMSRLDAVSKKFYIIYDSEKVTRDNVIDFFSARKLRATCLHKGVHGVDKVPDITADECK